MIVNSYYKRIFKRNHSYENVFPEDRGFFFIITKQTSKKTVQGYLELYVSHEIL